MFYKYMKEFVVDVAYWSCCVFVHVQEMMLLEVCWCLQRESHLVLMG